MRSMEQISLTAPSEGKDPEDTFVSTLPLVLRVKLSQVDVFLACGPNKAP